LKFNGGRKLEIGPQYGLETIMKLLKSYQRNIGRPGEVRNREFGKKILFWFGGLNKPA